MRKNWGLARKSASAEGCPLWSSTLRALLFLAASAGLLAGGWPPETRETRPWAYWWWMGSAVDPDNLTRELERYRAAGYGGVHIIPIYGARGYEHRYIPYLSPKWMEMMGHAVSEAARLGMGVDMTTGTGWNFGGPNISGANGCAQAVYSGGRVSLKPCGGPVERAAPGGEGPMLNPFYRPAIEHYLRRFSGAFAAHPGPRPRAMYHDSFEYGGNWSPDFLDEFARRRGYRLEKHLALLFGNDPGDVSARVKADYRETASDLLLDNFTKPWVEWSRAHGFITRDQAHGSPANWLDLYAAADIPETEMFRLDRSILVSKFASSAAHVAGSKLVAAETGTWLKEHFNERLADLKDMIDELFLAGANHLFFHGTCYSPDDAPWPGWLFYASTELNPRNSIWPHVPALTAYISRAQAVLQAGRPDSDILLYWPVHDFWHDPRGLEMNLSIHNLKSRIDPTPFGRLAEWLYRRGYTFDYVSDRQIAAASFHRGSIVVPGGEYRTLVFPPVEHMPVATLKAALRLSRAGAVVIFSERVPADVPGMADLPARRSELRALASNFRPAGVEAALAAAAVVRESLADRPGLHFVRRRAEAVRYYYIANRGPNAFEGWVPLRHAAKTVLILDAMTGEIGKAASRAASGGVEVFLQLDPGATVFLESNSAQTGAPAWPYVRRAAGRTLALKGVWRVEFITGGPVLPPRIALDELRSWTTFAGPEGERFAGTARYTLTFDRTHESAGGWELDLGDVRETARVTLNGEVLGTLIAPPMRVRVPRLKPTGNTLTVDVANLTANRIRDLDRRGVRWRIFRDINFVNSDYRPFDASSWPVRDSGLLGPVLLHTLEPRKR